MKPNWSAEFNSSYAVPAELQDESVFCDCSWHNDICPSFQPVAVGQFMDGVDRLRIWVEHPEQAKRELEGKRFTVVAYTADSDVHPTLETFETDDVKEAIAKAQEYAKTINAERLASEFSKILREWLTPEQLETVRQRNSTPEYVTACASHDFCDSNEAMAEAFLKIIGRECEVSDDADTDLINKAWAIAKAAGFTI